MTHDDAIERIHDLHAGTLDASSRDELEAHLRECEDCRSIDGAVQALQSAMPACEDDPDHPYPDEIVASVLDPGALADDDRGWVERHVAGCVSCAEQAEKVAAVEQLVANVEPFVSAGPSRGSSARRSVAVPWAVAASVLLAVLLYPAYLGLVRLPHVGEALDAARSDNERIRASVDELVASSESAERELGRLRDWSGVVELRQLRSALRSTGAVLQLRIAPDQPFVVLGIDVRIPRELPDGDVLRIRIASAADPTREVIVVDMTLARARRQRRDPGVVTMVVGTAALETGRYELDVFLPAHPETADLLEVPIDVVR